MGLYYSPDGEPMDVENWSRLFEMRRFDEADESWWRRRTRIGEIEVSTVWLGLDHGFGGQPLFWETMVFGWEEEIMRRYPSRQEAYDDHEEIVRTIRTVIEAQEKLSKES